MSVASAVHGGRMAAVARMLDTFDIKVPTGTTTYDPNTHTEVDVYTLLFSTQGRIKSASGLVARQGEAGGRTVVSVTRELHIPYDSPDVPVGAVAIVTALDETSDPTLAGVRLRLAGPAPGSQTTARRLEVSEVIA